VTDEAHRDGSPGKSLAARVAAARVRVGGVVADARAAAPGLVVEARARIDRRLAAWKKLDRETLGAKVEGWFKTRQAGSDPVTADAPLNRQPSLPRPEIAAPDETATARARAAARRPVLTLGLLLMGLVTGGILHILTVFAVIAWPSGSAYDRLRRDLEPNVMKVLPVAPTGAMPLPFLSPDMRYAVCRFDVTNGPVSVSATLLDLGWSLALYTPQGDNFSATPGQESRIVDASFTINPAGDRISIPLPGQRRADLDTAQVTSPSREGLVVIRAPIKGTQTLPLIERALAAATCRPAARR
jgi:uncharacterized membrane protein